ncbi:MAG: response regulator transcription factor [Chloroflexi bacterium]|nr:response regulator transcription factor [Chloroflexota bacterium]
MRVIIADDHSLFRDGFASLLTARGHDVVGEAQNGEEAVRLAQTLQPDVVLMDVTMPVMSGLVATRLIKATVPDVKVVMVTASEDDQDLFEAIKAGAEGFVNKNLESTRFFELLEGLPRGEAVLTPALAARIIAEFARQPRGGRETSRRSSSAQVVSPEDLTDREMDVLRLIVEGLSRREISEGLCVSENTVKFHLRNILDKLHLRNRAEVVAYAMRHGLVETGASERPGDRAIEETGRPDEGATE